MIVDTMVSLFMITPHEMAKQIALNVKLKRLALNLSQKTLAERSGVSYGVLKKFELTGKISLESLLKLALVLESLKEFSELFKLTSSVLPVSIDELIKDKSRKRGRK